MGFLVDDSVVVANLAYGSASNYLPVNSGTYTVRVNVAGTSNTVVGPLEVALGNQQVTTAYALGIPNSNTTPLTAAIAIDRAADDNDDDASSATMILPALLALILVVLI